MKTKKKNNYLALLLIPVCSLFAADSYAQQVDNSYVQKAETTEETEEAEEKLEVSGSGKITMGYNDLNHPAGKALTPALISAKAGDGGDDTADANKDLDDPFSTATSATLDMKKTIRWEGDPVKLDVGMTIGQGPNSTKLSKALAEFKYLVLGLKASNFGDSDIGPKCLAGTPNSAVGHKAMQLRFNKEQLIFPGLSLVFSLEEAATFKISEKYEGKLKKSEETLKEIELREDLGRDVEPDENQNCQDAIGVCKAKLSKKPFDHQPAIAVSLRYKYPGSRGHFYAGFLGRLLQYQDTQPAQPQNYSPLAGGICAGTKLQVWPERTTIKLQGVVGHGIGGYIQDLSALEKEDSTAYVSKNADKEGKLPLHIINAGGGYLAIEHHWIPKLLRSTGVLSGLWTYNEDEDRDKDCYKRGLYGSVSLSYHPTEQFYLGVEGAWGRKVCVGDGQNTATNGSRPQHNAYGVRMVAGFKL